MIAIHLTMLTLSVVMVAYYLFRIANALERIADKGTMTPAKAERIKPLLGLLLNSEGEQYDKILESIRRIEDE